MTQPHDPHRSDDGSPSTADKPREKRHVWDSRRNVRRLIQVFLGCCALLLLLDLVIHRHLTFHHGELGLEGWFGFYAVYGFVCCVTLVLVAKQMRKVVRRDEDYYER